MRNNKKHKARWIHFSTYGIGSSICGKSTKSSTMERTNDISKVTCKECLLKINQDSESSCNKPCSPDDPCDECNEYWHRMRIEGYWIDGKGWSDKAIKEMTK